jgi:hypothetical protein
MAEKKKSKKGEFQMIISVLILLFLVGCLARLGIKDARESRILKDEGIITIGELDSVKIWGGRGRTYSCYYVFRVNGNEYHGVRPVIESDYKRGLDSIPKFIEIKYAPSDPSINSVVKKDKE